MFSGEREDAGLGEAAELLEDAAALGDADGEGHLLAARAGGGHGGRAGPAQLRVVRAGLGHPLAGAWLPAIWEEEEGGLDAVVGEGRGW